MKTDFQTLPADSRVWIYQSSVPFHDEMRQEIQSKLDHFVDTWESHGSPLMASGRVLHNRFIVLIVDEKKTGVSGCSIDSSTDFIKAIGKVFGLELFDRFVFSYMDGEKIETISKEEFLGRYAEGIINDETLVFDNLVSSKNDFIRGWVKPLKDCWHRRFIR